MQIYGFRTVQKEHEPPIAALVLVAFGAVQRLV
jgi:hypothetical protein